MAIDIIQVTFPRNFASFQLPLRLFNINLISIPVKNWLGSVERLLLKENISILMRRERTRLKFETDILHKILELVTRYSRGT